MAISVQDFKLRVFGVGALVFQGCLERAFLRVLKYLLLGVLGDFGAVGS